MVETATGVRISGRGSSDPVRGLIVHLWSRRPADLSSPGDELPRHPDGSQWESQYLDYRRADLIPAGIPVTVVRQLPDVPRLAKEWASHFAGVDRIHLARHWCWV